MDAMTETEQTEQPPQAINAEPPTDPLPAEAETPLWFTRRLFELVRTHYSADKIPKDVGDEVESALLADKEFLNALTDYSRRSMVMATVYRVREHDIRIHKEIAPKPKAMRIVGKSKHTMEAMELGAAVMTASILDMPMPNGQTLGMQTGADLRQALIPLRSQANGMAKRLRLIERLAEMVPDNKLVKDAAPDADDLWRKINSK